MRYLSIAHNGHNGNGTCWYFKNNLLVKENTNHSDWLGPEAFGIDNIACGRYDPKTNLVSFVGYSISESRKEYIKKYLIERFGGKIIEC